MAETETEKGIRCPGCGCRDLPVTRTTQAAGGKIMRKRKCRNCKREFPTYEAPAGQVIDPPCMADFTPEQREKFWSKFFDYFRFR